MGAEVIMAANSFNFYVNGAFVGSETSGLNPYGQRIGSHFCVALEPGSNVFAVNASTTASSPGGLIATILVTYSDFTTDTILSNGTFRISSGSPAGFEQLSFNDTAWDGATVVGAYGDGPWGQIFIASKGGFVLFPAYWVWTDVIAAGTWPNLPSGQRAFRRTFTPTRGQTPASADIYITADDAYTLYVNGVQVGTGAKWTQADRYVVNFASAPTKVVVAVLVTNVVGSSPAGLLFSMEVNMAPTTASPATRGPPNCTAGVFVVSDNTWLSTTGAIPAGFQQPGFDDSAWPAVVEEALYGLGVWQSIVNYADFAPITI